MLKLATWRTKLRKRMSIRWARARGVARCQKVAAPSSTLTGTHRRTARIPATTRARARRPGGELGLRAARLGRGGGGGSHRPVREANREGNRRIEDGEIVPVTAARRRKERGGRKEGD